MSKTINIANFLSVLRILLIPVFLYFIFLPGFEMKMWGLAIFMIASGTDLLDGWFARKLGLESELGKFLDPLADKFLVIATLIAFVILDPLIPLWMVIIILGRDILITLMRYIAIHKGKSIRTSRFGKVKTAFQMFSIVVIIMVFIVRTFKLNIAPIDMHSWFDLVSIINYTLGSTSSNKWIVVGPYWLMFIVTLMTAISGIRYLIYNWKLLVPPYKKNIEDRTNNEV